jgi:hypothetical protein
MRITARLLFLIGAVAVISEAASAQQQFNGTWSVEVITEKGSCDRAYRYPVAIENGNVRYAGPESFNVSGSVNARGSIRGSISRGVAQANVLGTLSGSTGSGSWETTGAAACSGRWNAEKRT